MKLLRSPYMIFVSMFVIITAIAISEHKSFIRLYHKVMYNYTNVIPVPGLLKVELLDSTINDNGEMEIWYSFGVMLIDEVNTVYWDEERLILKNKAGSHVVLNYNSRDGYSFESEEMFQNYMRDLGYDQKIIFMDFLAAKKYREEELGEKFSMGSLVKINEAGSDVFWITEELASYYMKEGFYPEKLEDLFALEDKEESEYVKTFNEKVKDFIDPWGNHYYYHVLPDGKLCDVGFNIYGENNKKQLQYIRVHGNKVKLYQIAPYSQISLPI